MILMVLIAIGVVVAAFGTLTVVLVSREHIRRSREDGTPMFGFDAAVSTSIAHGCHVGHSHVDCGGHH
jgi:hypothetical protein